MFNLILYFIIGFSLVGLLVIIYQKIPALARLSEEEMIILERRKSLIQKFREINYKQHWLNLIIRLEKFLLRVKIIFLKTENLLSRWIEKLRRNSRTMTQKSREWIKQRELKRRESNNLLTDRKESIQVKLEERETPQPAEEDEEIPISELDKPIKEEQKWIDLIVEDPKNITAYKFLGLLYWKQHNYPDAKASLEMAVKLGSRDKKVKEILVELKKMGVKNGGSK